MARPGDGSACVENETIRDSNRLELESMITIMSVVRSQKHIAVPGIDIPRTVPSMKQIKWSRTLHFVLMKLAQNATFELPKAAKIGPVRVFQ